VAFVVAVVGTSSAILPGRLKMPRLSSASYFSTFSNQTEALEKPLANERVGCIEN